MDINGDKLLTEVSADLKIDLCCLVAGCAIWAPENQLVYSNVRRAKSGEKRREKIDEDGQEVTLDDNTYANKAIKNSVSHEYDSIKYFSVCHVWDRTCYDTRYHTLLANLVLLPRALASLTDHYLEIQRCLQYRAYELYEWHPEGESTPTKPANYPDNWRAPVKVKPKSMQVGGISQSSKRPTLPISFIPDDQVQFKRNFIEKGWATIQITYEDGHMETKVWEYERLTEKSNLKSNLRTRGEFRKGEWQKRNIRSVKVIIEE